MEIKLIDKEAGYFEGDRTLYPGPSGQGTSIPLSPKPATTIDEIFNRPDSAVNIGRDDEYGAGGQKAKQFMEDFLTYVQGIE